MRKSILENVHETAKDFYEAGLMDETTMRKFKVKTPKSKVKTPKSKVKTPKSKVKTTHGTRFHAAGITVDCTCLLLRTVDGCFSPFCIHDLTDLENTSINTENKK